MEPVYPKYFLQAILILPIQVTIQNRLNPAQAVLGFIAICFPNLELAAVLMIQVPLMQGTPLIYFIALPTLIWAPILTT